MSALQWRDWSCQVRVVLADGRPVDDAPEGATAQRAERLVRTLMHEVATACSRFLPDSDLSRVNAAAGRLVPVRPLTVDLVDTALAAARRTDGACDPTIGRHLEAAGYDADIDVVRRACTPHTRATAHRTAVWRAVRVDRSLGLLGVPAGLSIDLGATAKAWTADEAAHRLSHELEMPVLVAIGGDLAIGGHGPAWPVLVSEHENGPGEVVLVTGGGVATSSTRGRRWSTPDGDRHHLIDPRTGWPTTGSIRSASVVADTCVEANTLSTAALVWDREAPTRLAAHAARLVTTDGQVTTTSRWPDGVAA